MMKFLKGKRRPALAAPVVALSVLFGTAAGFIGGLMAVDYLYPSTWTGSSPAYLSAVSGQGQIGEDIVQPGTPVDAAARAQVLLFDRPAGGTPEDQIFWPSKAVAAGVVLTSDGWLVSHRAWPKGSEPEKSVAVIGTRTYPVLMVVDDPGSGALFLKVEANNLPVIGFEESYWPQPGDPLFALDPVQGPRRLDVVAFGHRPVKGVDDLVVSSDEIDQVLRLPTADGILSGSMVLNRSGHVVALFSGNREIGSEAVLVSDFSGQLEPVMREQRTERPTLGAHYVDLAHLMGGQARLGGHSKGALLVSANDGTRPALVKGGAALKAGLRAGDLILSVNGEEITAKRSLTQIIGDYRVGSEVNLRVLRGAFSGLANWRSTGRSGGELDIPVILE